MRTPLKAVLGLLAGAALCLTPQAAAHAAPPGHSAAAVGTVAADPSYKILVFSKTAGFRHSSIAPGIAALRDLGAANNFTVDATEDAQAFTTGNLGQYKTVAFLSTTGDVLNAGQQTAFEQYVRGGGGSSASTPPPTPSTTGPSTRAWPGPCSTPTRPSSPPP